MEFVPVIHTISKTMPPSYAEATGSAQTADHSYISMPTPTQPMYHQDPQMPGYQASPTYQVPNNFGLPNTHHVHLPYNQPNAIEASQPTTVTRTPCVHARQISPNKKICKCCLIINETIAIVLLLTILIFFIVKVILFRM